jgi:hypothetical protein
MRKFHYPLFLPLMVCLLVGGEISHGQTPMSSSTDFQQYAIKLREMALLKIEPQVYAPSSHGVSNRYPWKRNVMTTVFWVGERPTFNNPVPNYKSSWDAKWAHNYGGSDTPDSTGRRGFIPKAFVPRQNPFYVALPYNDISRGRTKYEASKVIPWFRYAFEKSGKTVLKGRWIAIRRGNRICYAQWEDCGPFRTDHYQYVFGPEYPRPNLNQGAGLDVSPAVRDYLDLRGKDYCDWKFVEFRDVPTGPWSKYGDNNTFVLQGRGADLFLLDRNNANGARR